MSKSDFALTVVVEYLPARRMLTVSSATAFRPSLRACGLFASFLGGANLLLLRLFGNRESV